jgi:hypothetical protein
MFGLNVYVPDPVGTIDATKQDKYNIHHRRNDAKLFVTEEITDNNHRQTGSLPPQYPHHYKIHHDSVTMHLNNLQNYNPTSAGITYFQEHETNKHIHHGGMHSHPANKTTPQHRDTTIPDKVDKWRKRSNIFESPAEHSHRLNIVKV